MLVGSAVRVQSHVWPKDPRCRCLVKLRSFEGACGLHSENVVPCMDQGPTVSGVVKGVCGSLWAMK